MLEKVYLLWDSYKKNRTYLIGVLSKKMIIIYLSTTKMPYLL